MNNNTTKNKHLTLEDPIEIEECLRHGMTFKAIGRRIGKDPSTVSGIYGFILRRPSAGNTHG